MAAIRSVVACTVRVPLDRPTAFATRRVTARDYTLVRVRGDGGVEGIGFCYGGSSGGSLVTDAVRRLFAPMLPGEDPYRVEGLWQAMYQESLLHGRAGAVMRALSALDIALWDRNARAAGLPLYRYLGAYSAGPVPAYASGGYYLEGKTPAMLGAEMAGYVAQGFRAVKMKVGRLDPAGDAARVAAAREAIGPDDVESHARLAERTGVPVATGEIEAGRWRFKELLDRRAAAILQADAAVCGGVTEFRRIAATAASYGVTLCPHWFHDLHVHLVAATPNARFVEFFPDDQVLNFRRLVGRQLEVRDGALVLPEAAGLGFEFDAAAVAKYAVDGWS